MALLTKKNRWYWIGGAVLVALLIGGAIKSQSKGKGEEVETQKVGLRRISERVQASGKVYPVQEIKITSDVSGEVVQLLVKEGDSVKAGQLLARINADIYESGAARTKAILDASRAQAGQSRAGVTAAKAQIEQFRAQMEQMESSVALATQNNQRNEQLYTSGVIAEAELQASRNALKVQQGALRAAQAAENSAKSSLAQAEAGVSAAESNVRGSEASQSEANASLKRTSIFAPMSGVVSKLSVEQGERVVGAIQMSGTELMRIANLSSMEVQVDVNENEILRIHRGDKADIEVDAYSGRKFSGVVTEIARSASNAFSSSGMASLNSDQVTNFVVKILVDPASYAEISESGSRTPFLPGMSATADIYTQAVDNVIAVPIAAVAQRENEAFTEKKKSAERDEDETTNIEKTIEDIRIIVFVMSGDSVKMVDVKTGIQDDEFIHITKGLTGQEEIVIGPYNLVARELNAGDKVVRKEEKKEKKKKK